MADGSANQRVISDDEKYVGDKNGATHIDIENSATAK